MKGAFVIALLVSVAAAAKVTFDGHQVLRLTIGDDAQLRVLNELLTESQAGASDLDWWDEPTHVGDFTDIRVAPAAKQSMASFISSHGIESRVMIEDLQALIDQQAAQKAAQPKSADWFSDYHSYDDGVKWLTDLVAQYSHIASMKVIGQSYEKNNIHAIEITGAGGANVTKPAIFLDAGMHAREWISMATVQYIVNQLLTKYDSDQEVKKYVDSIRWTIVPFYNPDGYKYTWATDRMWRKSRTPNAGSSCAGTDPNRNLPIGFGGASTSSNPCSDVYYGKNPKDEPCVKVVTDALEATDNLMAYINFHSYSQTFLSPYDYTTTKPPEPDFTNQATMRKAYVAAIKKSTGVTYSEQLGCDLYPSGGGMPDYVYVDLGVVFSFTCELRDTGTYGFLLPASQISPTGQENFAGVKALAAAVLA